jgi:hypothetical protein
MLIHLSTCQNTKHLITIFTMPFLQMPLFFECRYINEHEYIHCIDMAAYRSSEGQQKCLKATHERQTDMNIYEING